MPVPLDRNAFACYESRSIFTPAIENSNRFRYQTRTGRVRSHFHRRFFHPSSISRMRKEILCCFSSLLVIQLHSQLTIQPGASLYLRGNALLTLENISFQNDGQFFPDSSTVLFSGGTANRSISGSGTISFHELHIDRATGLDVVLQSPISVGNRIHFITGNLFIGNHDVNLGRTGMLQNESEFDRVRTTGTGRVIAMRTINNAFNQMPGNIGVSISTTENLGDVIVRRGHLPQSGAGLTTSIQRYYEIEPQFTPSNAAATLRLSYLDAELNGLDENTLHIYRSSDNSNWNHLGFTLRHTNVDYVEVTGVQAFRRFTLGGPSGALPVRFVHIGGRCEGDKAIITWQTAQEENSLHFEVQRSSGSRWNTLGIVPSTGNSNTFRSYSVTDANPLGNAQYRIAEKGLDGRMQYSSVLRLSCSGENNVLLYPNPATTQVSVQWQSAIAQTVKLQLRDGKGAIVREHSASVQRGVNVFPFDLARLAAGSYHLSAIDQNGQRLFSTPLLKQ